jgi:hypothetical protein
LTAVSFDNKLIDCVVNGVLRLKSAFKTNAYNLFLTRVLEIVQAEINLTGVVIVVGNYGSGKTEVAINLAVDQTGKGRRVSLADLDLVNPYFRTREARHALGRLGVEMVLPPEELLQADLPVLAPQVAGAIRKTDDLTILDVGGDPVGAKVLAALADAFGTVRQTVQIIQVVNHFRPNTSTVRGCLQMRAAIEAAAAMRISGWAGNSHLLDETTIEHISQGYRFMKKLADESAVPLAFITIADKLLTAAAGLALDCPVLAIRRQLVPPWGKAADLNIALNTTYQG